MASWPSQWNVYKSRWAGLGQLRQGAAIVALGGLIIIAIYAIT